ncbi:MAG TPA: WD40 repeat domain-containing protein [Cyanobacteria bacterium UBA11149]|nr:WD40 repeat domain-containing protein [Cyanobacteria bacterium UBA11367]HBE57334.1 WD40 repeat domain-containing protein [Cyanobacteria bacterium UBA11366]HBK64439.1 WD40 repeat domain-containing protein [Cyanobacteria bacterium UBA11166]HBR72329.1 WD40 repeat domain-containing protein [Cyanobacteria bacterium UBA11159]HBS70415.1 WD40 repeat domain-containing protein [Cyanobacteria bacterium UBA11153]HBW89359.1 WD40 repeat domain-containing protein [Cyanobacteria bacterium UBA11149]HCA9765
MTKDRIIFPILGVIAATLTGAGEMAMSQSIPVPVPPNTPTQPLPPSNIPSFSNSWRNPELLYTIDAHATVVDSLLFSPDGATLISGGSYNDGKLKLWDVKTGRSIDKIRAQRVSVTQLAIAPDSSILASCGEDSALNLWNWETGEYTHLFLEHTSNLLALAITPDSRVLASGGLDGIRLWDLKKQRPIYNLARFDHQTYSLAIHPQGDILASGHKFGSIKLWNIKTGQSLGSISAHNRPVDGLAFTPDGQTLVSGSYDRTIKIWNIRNRTLLRTLSGHTGRIWAIAMNPDGETLASASRDGIRLWNIKTGELLKLITVAEDWAQSVAFSPDGKLLATGGFDSNIRIWQVPSAVKEESVVETRETQDTLAGK